MIRLFHGSVLEVIHKQEILDECVRFVGSKKL